jgi:hypothetical protein
VFEDDPNAVDLMTVERSLNTVSFLGLYDWGLYEFYEWLFSLGNKVPQVALAKGRGWQK